MSKARFYDRADDLRLRFAVIVAESDGRRVFRKYPEAAS